MSPVKRLPTRRYASWRRVGHHPCVTTCRKNRGARPSSHSCKPSPSLFSPLVSQTKCLTTLYPPTKGNDNLAPLIRTLTRRHIGVDDIYLRNTWLPERETEWATEAGTRSVMKKSSRPCPPPDSPDGSYLVNHGGQEEEDEGDKGDEK